MSTDTIANIKGRSLNKTGVTETLARQYANQLGTEHIAIVRFEPDSLVTGSDGHQKVILAINSFEPVLDPSDDVDIENHVRELERALWRNRGEADGQSSIDDELDGPSPSVKDVLQTGEAMLEKDDDGQTSFWQPGDDPAPEVGPGAAGDPFSPGDTEG